jgi:HD-GYP domain-containing protein (c-di-GMP phosphodiesterase class II)
MTVKKKLIASSILLIALFIFIGSTLFLGYRNISREAALTDQLDSELVYLQMLLRGLNEVLINEGTPDSLNIAREGLDGFDAIHMHLLSTVENPDMRILLTDKIDQKWKAIKKGIEPFLAYHYLELDIEDDDVLIKYGRLIAKAEDIISDVNMYAGNMKTQLNTKSKNILFIIVFSFLGTLIIISIHSFRLHTAITHPIGELLKIAEGFNKGDLGVMMDESRKDEFGSLAKHFNKSIKKLGHTTILLQDRTQELTESGELIQTQLNRLNALRSIDKAILGNIDMRVVLDIFIDHVMRQLNPDAVSVLLLNQKTQTLEFYYGKGFRTSTLKHTRLRLGQSNAGRAAIERRIINITNLKENSAGFERSKAFEGESFISYFAVPLIAKGDVKGVLEVFHRTELDADRDWLEFLEAIADQGAIAIDSATMFDELKRSNIDLSMAYDNTIEGWSRALDMRDKETEGHSRRVTEMTICIASEMGIKDEDLVHIRRGALLHDIGKLGIPDSILLKPGKLTDEEWITMKRHSEYAYEMLYPIEHLRPALDIPFYHHEKWDGSGYPKGLKGEEIPLAARIFAVVDVWDALCSDRPYRPAWPKEKVIKHVRSLSGTHFDPEALEIFFRIELDKDSNEVFITTHNPAVIPSAHP